MKSNNKATWRSSVEIGTLLEQEGNLDALFDIYQLSVFFSDAVYPSDYRADPAWVDAVVLTDSGRAALSAAGLPKQPAHQPDFLLAVFCQLFHLDLLVDWRQTDCGRIRALLDAELRANKIRFAYRYGRVLYDRFSTMVSSRTDHLEAADVARLLADTEPGGNCSRPHLKGCVEDVILLG